MEILGPRNLELRKKSQKILRLHKFWVLRNLEPRKFLGQKGFQYQPSGKGGTRSTPNCLQNQFNRLRYQQQYLVSVENQSNQMLGPKKFVELKNHWFKTTFESTNSFVYKILGQKNMGPSLVIKKDLNQRRYFIILKLGQMLQPDSSQLIQRA